MDKIETEDDWVYIEAKKLFSMSNTDLGNLVLKYLYEGRKRIIIYVKNN